MDEQAARDVLLVKAIETTDQAREVLSDDDRRYASRSARELAQWDAAEKKQPLTTELFLHKRAQQILARLGERKPAAAVFFRTRPWGRLAALALPALAFLCGVLVDRIGDPHHVDLLSAPLLLMMIWNLAVYASLLLWPLLPAAARPRLRLKLPPRTRRAPPWLAASLARFNAEWLSLSAPLQATRLKRVLHLSAALLALGAAVSLYLRGMLSQYRVGWESTFLDAGQVHALLSLLFAPAMWLLRLPGFTLEQVRALQFPQAATDASGALWVHLYAATLLLLVILPRLALAALAWRRERRLAGSFSIDLALPYFSRLCAGLTPAAAAALWICPYSYRVSESQRASLGDVAHMLLGEQASLALAESTAYGEAAAAGTAPAGALRAALFSLSATPEQENHGAFLDQLRRESGGSAIALVDESAYLERLGAQAAARGAERATLWRQFCAQHQTPVAIVNLREPQRHINEIEGLLVPGTGAP
ncbi:MAG: DUF2868 domain-containing protein [Noviherbaspirillum sp.]